MKDLRSASEANISAAGGDSATASVETDDDTSQTAANSKLFEKYAPVVAQFKVCMCNVM